MALYSVKEESTYIHIVADFDMIKLELWYRGVHNNIIIVQTLGGHYNFQYYRFTLHLNL